MSFLLFLDIFCIQKCLETENSQIPWQNHYFQMILSFFLFLDTFWIQKCPETEKRPITVPLISVPFQREAWEVYPLEVYYPDDTTRLCRPKAGQSLVGEKNGKIRPKKESSWI